MNLWLGNFPRPLIVAHRGSSANAPENTLDAFRQALKDQADAIELDVQLSRDGRVLVFHDVRLSRTTNGRGKLHDRTFRELRSLHAGYRFLPSWRTQKIPSLEEVLDLVHGKAGLDIEIKIDRRRKSLDTLVDKCCEIVRAFRAERYVLLTSFSREALRRIAEHRPRFVTGLLHYPLSHRSRSPIALAQEVGAEYLVVSGTALTSRLVHRAREKGLRLGEYTVNSASRVRRAKGYDLEMIIADDPAKARRYLCLYK
jgi:glycerophosphoryl diester phosphodiesterase